MEAEDLVTFTEEILYEKLHFVCSVREVSLFRLILLFLLVFQVEKQSDFRKK